MREIRLTSALQTFKWVWMWSEYRVSGWMKWSPCVRSCFSTLRWRVSDLTRTGHLDTCQLSRQLSSDNLTAFNDSCSLSWSKYLTFSSNYCAGSAGPGLKKVKKPSRVRRVREIFGPRPFIGSCSEGVQNVGFKGFVRSGQTVPISQKLDRFLPDTNPIRYEMRE